MASTTIFAQRATMRIDAQTKHQHITGFGGFVCSPQFTYNHMSTTEIKRVWGKTSTVGCNIMRLYIPIGKNSWSQSLQTAKNAKQMGLIVFASPWGQPAEWKTNGTSNAKNSDGTLGYLKKEHWADYAQYLEDYVQYMRNNGVELDAISIQNEPDWQAEYAGCMWSASDIATFVKTYGRTISCKIIAPETLGVSDSYANALNKDDVLQNFDIYGGHQYGGLQSAYKNLGKKGKELWMTEYLINWNEAENNTRSFDFSKDFFNFFSSINQCMLGDFNAWIHYAAKRYYAMLGDGQRGTTSGVVTKRGYIMAHFARFVTGMTRIEGTFANANLEGSAYLSVTGDTVVAVISNPSDEAYELTLDLPFYTQQGKLYTTSKTTNFKATSLEPASETCRPTATIAAQSVNTVLFMRSRDRQPSAMKGTVSRFDRLDDMKTTKTSFGVGYKMSGKTKTFDHSTPLISSRTNTTYGYIDLNERFSKLVLTVKKVTSTMNYTSSQTTLCYVNAKGQVATHDYGELDLSRRENFSIVFDLSPSTLTDGCIGLLGITNNNYSSKLTLNLGDVYLTNGDGYAAKLSGAYVADDSNVLDYTEDAACTSIDLTNVSELPAELPWLTGNRIAYLPEGSSYTGNNAVVGSTCRTLALTPNGGNFRPATTFTADAATFTCTVNGLQLLMLPFNAALPEGARAYKIADDLSLQEMRSVPAHEPVLIDAAGEVTLTGSGEISYSSSPLSATIRGSYTSVPLYAGDYVLGQQDGKWGFVRLTENATLSPFGAYAHPTSAAAFLPLDLTPSGINDVEATTNNTRHTTYNLMGQKVSEHARGIIIKNGKKLLRR